MEDELENPATSQLLNANPPLTSNNNLHDNTMIKLLKSYHALTGISNMCKHEPLTGDHYSPSLIFLVFWGELAYFFITCPFALSVIHGSC